MTRHTGDCEVSTKPQSRKKMARMDWRARSSRPPWSLQIAASRDSRENWIRGGRCWTAASAVPVQTAQTNTNFGNRDSQNVSCYRGRFGPPRLRASRRGAQACDRGRKASVSPTSIGRSRPVFAGRARTPRVVRTPPNGIPSRATPRTRKQFLFHESPTLPHFPFTGNLALGEEAKQ